MLTSAFKFDLSEEVFSFQRYFVLNHKCNNPEEQGSALNPVVFSLSLHLNGDPVSHALAHSVGLVRVEQIQLVRVLFFYVFYHELRELFSEILAFVLQIIFKRESFSSFFNFVNRVILQETHDNCLDFPDVLANFYKNHLFANSVDAVYGFLVRGPSF